MIKNLLPVRLPILCTTLLLTSGGLAEELTYERDVRRILKTHCFQCHGEGEVLEGGLDLRLWRLIARGGDSGPVVIAADPAESPLFQRVRDGEMPPEEVPLRPTAEEMETLRRWIAEGALARRAEPDDLNPDNYLTEEERSFWSFRPIVRHQPPVPDRDRRVRTPIDQFIQDALAAKNLGLSVDAERRTLIRRVYFDLLGIPPSPGEVAEFIDDTAPGAYEQLLDRVLNSPHYGERWARHWLDVAGYADSEGYTDEDPVRANAYKYRDYVIRSFNEDRPFDQFVLEQLAGDELLGKPLDNLTPDDTEKLIATGFLRMAPDGTGVGGVDQQVARNEVIAKTIEIVSGSLLGLTVGCAQCHNHRYDPISQEDYYAIRAIFEPALNWKEWLPPAKRGISLYTDADRAKAAAIEAEAQKVVDERTRKQAEFIEATFQRELAKLEEAVREPIATARNTPEKERTAEQQELLKKYPSVNVTAGSLYLYDSKAADELKRLAEKADGIRATKPKEEFVRALWEPAGQAPPATFLFYRGDHEQPRQEVTPRELAVLTSTHAIELPADDGSLPTSGRRLAYARWLTSGRHPLLSRVIVNRVWLHHFGQGLVATPGDFGALGVPPTHPELLDWLANEFVASGWSVKKLQRLILTSSTYRQASLRRAEGEAIDPENRLYWRMPVRRMEAEVLRDSTLAVSGELNTRAFGPAVPVMADRVGQFVIGKENLDAGRPGAVIPMHGEELRRSIYIESRRSRPLSVLAPFDLPRMEPNCTSRNASTVSTQSLLLMNSDFVLTRAQQFARRVKQEAGDDAAAQVDLAWQLAFSAAPTADELGEGLAFLEDQAKRLAASQPESKENIERDFPAEALASFCQALLSSNRFLYVD